MEPELLPNVRPHILVLGSGGRGRVRDEEGLGEVNWRGEGGAGRDERLTISTSFSKKGTSFSSSLSFLSMNQLSMGIPLDNWKQDGPRYGPLAFSRRALYAGVGIYLIREGLW